MIISLRNHLADVIASLSRWCFAVARKTNPETADVLASPDLAPEEQMMSDVTLERLRGHECHMGRRATEAVAIGTIDGASRYLRSDAFAHTAE